MDDDVARLYLVQKKAIGAGLQSILLVRIPYLGIRQFMKSMPTVAANAREYLTRVGSKPPKEIDKTDAPNQTFTVDANIVAVAFSGREACIDLYHASPYVIHGLKSGGDFYAEPVARINLGTQVLLDIYDTIDRNSHLIPADE